MLRLCPFVPLSCALALAGCFDAHGIHDDAGTRPDAVTTPADVGPPLRDAEVRPLPRDAGVRPDTGPGLDGGACDGVSRIERAGSACLPEGGGVIPSGVPYALPIAIDGCFCTEDLSCTARTAGPFVLELSTHLCDHGDECDGCTPRVETTCALPPLERGTWRVRVNGTDAFDVPVDAPPPSTPTERCWSFASAADGALLCPWPGDALSTSGGSGGSACHATRAPPGVPIAVTIANPCAGCFDQWGECAVVVAGRSISVTPRERACDCPTCGACAEVCVLASRACHLPPLETGEYVVTVDGMSSSTTLTVAVGAPSSESTCSYAP